MHEKIIASGRPASSGVAKGVVRVVTKLEELRNVNSNTILVVKTSNPAWTIGLMKAKGLVSELGGIISHTAIVAREIGIPCIVSVENATTIFRNGQKIKIDGNRGMIYGA